MKTFQSIYDLRAYRPAPGDQYAFYDQKKEVYMWIGGEWVRRVYFDVKQMAGITGYSMITIRHLLKTHGSWFDRKKKKGHIRLNYGQVLKLKYMLDALMKGQLEDILLTGKLENLYANPRDYHAIEAI